MKRVLVPVDFSNTSLNALDYAVKLFVDAPLEITIMHTYEVSSSAFSMKSIDSILADDAQREMDALLTRMRKEHPTVAVQAKIMKSKAIAAITSLGNSGDYDYIVMGTKGASGLKEVFLGSVAGGVITGSSVPVLVIPGHCEYRSLSNTVFAVSSNPLSKLSILEPLRKLAAEHNSKINLLYVAKDQEPDLDPIIDALKEFLPTVTYNYGQGSVNEQINSYLEKEDAQLLCLIRSKKDFFDQLLTESVTLNQTFNSPVPLLILHA